MRLPRGTIARIIAAVVALVVMGESAALALPYVIGHRGMIAADVPENTMYSIKKAAPDSSWIEVDVRAAKDSSDPDGVGMLLVMHDSTLDRTTNCTGYVHQKLWSEISKCRTEPGGQPIPSLAQVVAWSKTANKKIMFDVKIAMNAEMARYFWSLARQVPAGSIVSGALGRQADLERIRYYDRQDGTKNLRYGYVVQTAQAPLLTVAKAKALGNEIMLEKGVSKTTVQRFQDAGMRVYLWTLTSEADYAKAISYGVYAGIVDNPAAFKRYKDTLT